MEIASVAGFGSRFIAITLDWLMSWAVAMLITRKSFDRVRVDQFLIFFLEVAILTILQQASAGQKLLRLRVVDEGSGGRVSLLRILTRTILICLVVPAVFTKDGVGYHDILTRTRVIRI